MLLFIFVVVVGVAFYWPVRNAINIACSHRFIFAVAVVVVVLVVSFDFCFFFSFSSLALALSHKRIIMMLYYYGNAIIVFFPRTFDVCPTVVLCWP